MSNVTSYKDIMAFHPGYYISEMIEDMEITQAEFAMRMGTTPKTLSQLVNGQANLSNDLAEKLSLMIGNSVEFWLNLQKAYDKKVLEIQRIQELDQQIPVMDWIDYSYFVQVANLPVTRNITEKIRNLCSYLKVANLNTFRNPDFLVNFRTGVSEVQEKNTFNARIWLQTAMNHAQAMPVRAFNASKLKEYLPEIRSMTLQKPDVFYPRLCEIFSECGVAFVLLPYLKNSGINGAVKWVNPNCVVLAMNNRMTHADTFWFSLFHEIKHVLQQKTKTVFISSNLEEMKEMDSQLEAEADTFAQNYLLPEKEYRQFSNNPYISDCDIMLFAKKMEIHPGIVVGRLQHDRLLPPNRCSHLKEQYQILPPASHPAAK